MGALKEQRSPLKAQAHLSPEEKKNKVTVYHRIRNADTRIEDRGDKIVIYWRKDTQYAVM